MDLDLLFRALSDATRRRLIDELAERDGQTLFELHVRLITYYGASLSRQALSKHLQVLEEAGLLRTEWQWRSKHHFLDLTPLRHAWTLWLAGHAGERAPESRPSAAEPSAAQPAAPQPDAAPAAAPSPSPPQRRTPA
ncbi:helix-turn-helix domain-containing protein [Rhodoplanes serenus]|uniref:Helix-turn-helix domain-containing protein n=1 Tax=Rhodoplanes serenus TaxID=200615 RepID=A0A9X4XHQ4_9BRAD|nr:helix-turn-helix domain-containing protein [Rhodoplanes serenus]MTW15238.1 helix-turn-helix domain-containing protein [Rhodoplanes serenus]